MFLFFYYEGEIPCAFKKAIELVQALESDNPSSHHLFCPCQEDGIRTLINVFHGAAIHPGMAFLSSSRGLHGPVSSYLPCLLLSINSSLLNIEITCLP